MRRLKLGILLGVGLGFFVYELPAQTCSIPSIGSSYSGVSGIHVTFSGDFPFIGSLGDAAALWNAGCTTTSGGHAYPGDDYPEFDFYYGERDLYFQWMPGWAPSATCTDPSTGALAYCASEWHENIDTVRVYERWGPPQPGGAPPPYLTSSYGYDTRISLWAHEIAHALGLGDTTCGSITNPALGAGATIIGPECNRVDTNNIVPGEDPQNDPKDNPGGTPIIIDTQSDGYQLTSLQDGVLFDIDANGSPNRIAWTAAASDDAFLWLDRNGNGTVDDGAELFGDVHAANGFETLLQYDARHIGDVFFGGNANGMIDSGDLVWSGLLLWFDRDHNGRSTPDEIALLAGSGVVGIDLDYRWVGRRDRYGNAFRYRSDLYTRDSSGKVSMQHVYDIFFVFE